MASRPDVTSLVFGGILIGSWLALLAHLEGDSGWLLWGLVGLALASGVYGARAARGTVRLAIYVAVGVLAGFLVTLLAFRQEWQGIATILTLAGGALVLAASPLPGQHLPPAPPAHDSPDEGR